MKYNICRSLLTCGQLIFGQAQTDCIRTNNEALKLIELPEPQFDEPYSINPSPKDIEDLGFDQPNKSKTIVFNMIDSVKIEGKRYPLISDKTVILVHRVLANSYTYNKTSGFIIDA